MDNTRVETSSAASDASKDRPEDVAAKAAGSAEAEASPVPRDPAAGGAPPGSDSARTADAKPRNTGNASGELVDDAEGSNASEDASATPAAKPATRPAEEEESGDKCADDRAQVGPSSDATASVADSLEDTGEQKAVSDENDSRAGAPDSALSSGSPDSMETPAHKKEAGDQKEASGDAQASVEEERQDGDFPDALPDSGAHAPAAKLEKDTGESNAASSPAVSRESADAAPNEGQIAEGDASQERKEDVPPDEAEDHQEEKRGFFSRFSRRKADQTVEKPPLVLKPRGAAGMALLVIGAVLCGFTVVNLLVGNQNLGVYLPAIVGLPLLLWGIFKVPLNAWFARSRLARFLRGLVMAVYVVFLCVFGICAAWIGFGFASQPEDNADAVIVLGAAVHGNEVTDTLQKRLDKAIEYHDGNPDSLIVVTGGMGSNENVTEAQAMHDYLIDAGIPEDVILMEEDASSTAENFANSKKLLDERFGGVPLRIVYVTSDFHVMRAGTEAQAAGFNDAAGLGAPTPILTVPGAWLRESAALVYNFVRGTVNLANEIASSNPSDTFLGMLLNGEQATEAPNASDAAETPNPSPEPSAEATDTPAQQTSAADPAPGEQLASQPAEG